MARTATEASSRLIALALPGTPESVPIARRRVRAALGFHGLGEFTEDAEFITSDSLNLSFCPDWDCFWF